MRARRPGRQSDEVMGPRALAAMADAARRSREAGVAGPSPTGQDAHRVDHSTIGVDDAASADVDFEPPAPDVRATASAPSLPPPTRPTTVTPSSTPTDAPQPDQASRANSAGSIGFGPSSAASAVAASAVARSGSEPRPGRTVGQGDRRRRSSLLIMSVSLMAIVAALLATWAVKDGGGSPASSGRPAVSSHTAPDAPPNAQAGHESGPAAAPPGTTSVTTTTHPAATTTTTSAPATGSGPVLSAIEPASGAPGQVIVVSGSNLMSTSGQISAQFGAETSTVACLAPTSCLVIVPTNGSPSATVPLTITTDGGTSNTLNFTYS